MDIDQILDSSTSNTQELIITNEIRGFLAEAAKWCKFLAITGFVITGLMGLMMIFGGAALFMSPLGVGGGAFMLFYLVFLALYIFPLLYMYRFAVQTQKALAADDQLFLRDAFENLKSLFKFMGILTIVVLGIYALAAIGGLLFTMMA